MLVRCLIRDPLNNYSSVVTFDFLVFDSCAHSHHLIFCEAKRRIENTPKYLLLKQHVMRKRRRQPCSEDKKAVALFQRGNKLIVHGCLLQNLSKCIFQHVRLYVIKVALWQSDEELAFGIELPRGYLWLFFAHFPRLTIILIGHLINNKFF